MIGRKPAILHGIPAATPDQKAKAMPRARGCRLVIPIGFDKRRAKELCNNKRVKM
jgi:hypothetical protein